MAFKQFRKWEPGEFVICFCDVAAGGLDSCAGQFLSQKYIDIAEVYHQHVTGTFMTPLIHNEMLRIAKVTGVRPVVAFERNNGGGFEMERLSRLNRTGEYDIYTMKSLNAQGQLVDTGKLGWDTNAATRPKMLTELKDAVEGELIHIYDRKTINELFSFIINANGRPEAEVGAHDDLVMALAGAWQLYQTEVPSGKSEVGFILPTAPNESYEQGVYVTSDGQIEAAGLHIDVQSMVRRNNHNDSRDWRSL